MASEAGGTSQVPGSDDGPDNPQLSNFVQRKKRPGPKRDSKPAPSEKLERNRQAQRSHRERKETYLKELEYEVMRLKDLYVQVVRERDTVTQERDQAIVERSAALEETRRLREVIQTSSFASLDSTYGDVAGSASFATSVAPDGAPTIPAVHSAEPITDPSTIPAQNQSVLPMSDALNSTSRSATADDLSVGNQSLVNPNPLPVDPFTSVASDPSRLDYDEIGLDFVLTLERPCMQHLQYLIVRAHNPEHHQEENGAVCSRPPDVPDDGENQQISGHNLMASAPSLQHVREHPHDWSTQALPDVKRPDLLRLLNMSQRLPWISEQELPPVRAWHRILQDERMKQLMRDDFELLKKLLVAKVNCYRFGAVIYESDIVDAVNQILEARASGSMDRLLDSSVPSCS